MRMDTMQEGPVQLLLRQVAVVREPAGRGVRGEQRPGPGQAGEPVQQAAARAPVLLHPAGRVHLAHRAAALPPAHRRRHHREQRRRRRRRRQWLAEGRYKSTRKTEDKAAGRSKMHAMDGWIDPWTLVIV